MAKMGGRFARFGWPGASDRIGQLIDGRLLALEVKGPRGKLQADQAEFLSLVRRFGSAAFNASAYRYVY